MSILSKIFGRKTDGEQQKTGGMEDFMTLIRVYFQASMAADLGITNLAALPDLRVFKTTLRVPTVNNRLGIGERSRCKKMPSICSGVFIRSRVGTSFPLFSQYIIFLSISVGSCPFRRCHLLFFPNIMAMCNYFGCKVSVKNRLSEEKANLFFF